MNKETILKEYEETIQKRFDLFMLLANFDNNTEFSHSRSHTCFNLLRMQEQILNQYLLNLEMIALNENILEIFDIQRKHIDKLASTSGN